MNAIADLLVTAATEVLRPRSVDGRGFGEVASALLTVDGDVFQGVSIDTTSGTGFCAEHAAIAAMVTAGQHRIDAIVAVWRDEDEQLHAVPPCGRCREFIMQVAPENTMTRVVLGPNEVLPLSDLLPHNDWPGPTLP